MLLCQYKVWYDLDEHYLMLSHTGALRKPPLGVETLIKLSFKENELLKTIKLLWYLLNKPFNIKQHQGEI